MGREKDFPYTELHPEDIGETFALLRRAEWAHDDRALAERTETLSTRNVTDVVQLLIPPHQ